MGHGSYGCTQIKIKIRENPFHPLRAPPREYSRGGTRGRLCVSVCYLCLFWEESEAKFCLKPMNNVAADSIPRIFSSHALCKARLHPADVVYPLVLWQALKSPSLLFAESVHKVPDSCTDQQHSDRKNENT